MKTFDEAINEVLTAKRTVSLHEALRNADEIFIKYDFIKDIENNSDVTKLFSKILMLLLYNPTEAYATLRTLFYLGLITGIEMEKDK